MFRTVSWLIGLTVMVLIGLFFLNSPAYLPPDGVEYLTGARFISRGLGYGMYGYFPHQILPQVNSPPFLSFAISVVMRFSGWNEVMAFKAVNLLSLIVYFCAYGYLVRTLFNSKFLYFFALFFIVNAPVIWRYVNLVMTEVLFTGILSLLFVMCLNAMECERKKMRWILFFLGGGLATILSLTRFAGIYVTAGCLLAFWLSGKSVGFKSKMMESICFIAPVVVGWGGWLLRNSRMQTSLYYLSSLHRQPVLEHVWPLQARFLNTVAGVLIQGFPLSDLSDGRARILMAASAFVFFALLIWLALEKKKNLALDSKRLSFLLLAGAFVTIYILANNLTWMIRGFGITARYFYVLFPVFFIAALLILDDVRGEKGISLRKKVFSKPALLIGLMLWSHLCHAWEGQKYFTAVMKEMNGPMSFDQKIFDPVFGRSPWVLRLLREKVAENDLLMSNERLYLAYLTDRPCAPVSFLESETKKMTNLIAADRGFADAISHRIFVVWRKATPGLSVRRDELKTYVSHFEYHLLQQDEHVMVLELRPKFAPSDEAVFFPKIEP